MNKLKYLIAALIGVAALGLQQSKADVLNFNLNQANVNFAGPYVNVNVNRTSGTTATVTFTSLTNSGNIYLMGKNGAAALNVNATTFTVGSFNAANSGTGFTPGPLSQGAAGNEDGFGSFNLTINSFDGFTHSSSSISFVLTNTSGTWSSVADVLTGNNNGNIAAAGIFVTSFPANASNTALATGFAAGNGGTNTAPDGGATVMLLGAALGALGMVRRYLKN